MSEETETNPVEDFIDAVQQKNFNAAKDMFDSLLGDKVHARLDAEKIAVADSIFNSADDDIEIDEYDEDEEIVEDDFDIDDELEDEDTAEDEGKHIYAGGQV